MRQQCLAYASKVSATLAISREPLSYNSELNVELDVSRMEPNSELTLTVVRDSGSEYFGEGEVDDFVIEVGYEGKENSADGLSVVSVTV